MTNIVLVGIMGSGKSTTARVLSKKLNMKWVDTDNQIESQSGKKVSDLFEISEDYFRTWEHTICKSLKSISNSVISTGGGIIINEKNRSIISSLGTVIYLKISPEAAIKRLKNDTKRPLLKKNNKLEILKNLLDERDPLYNEVSSIQLIVDELTIDDTINQILKQVRAK